MAPVPPTLTVSVEEDVSSVPDVQTAGRPAEPEPVKLEPPVQTPLMAKHPVVALMPLAKVEVPVPPTFTMPLVWMLPSVVVAMPIPSPPRIVASSAIDKSPAPMMESPTPFRVRPVWKVVVAVTVN